MASSTPLRCGCFPPIFGRRRGNGQKKRTVRFSSVIDCGSTSADSHRSNTPVIQRRLSRKKTHRPRYSPDRASFYSAVSHWDESTFTNLNSSSFDDKETDGGDDTGSIDLDTLFSSKRADYNDSTVPAPKALCPCGFETHKVFDPSMPIAPCSDVKEGSYEELLIHSKALVGRWVTLLDRSESLDPQMVYVGINKMKRMVLNRLTIVFEAILENNDKTLVCWIETPVGKKYTHASLVGEELLDEDGDLGSWTSRTYMCNYSTQVFCNGRTIRAMQLERKSLKLGTAYETRAILPDKEYGKVFLYNITIQVNDTKTISVNRIYKPIS